MRRRSHEGGGGAMRGRSQGRGEGARDEGGRAMRERSYEGGGAMRGEL